MDNLTHSLVGAVLAEILFHQTSLAQSRKRAWPVRTVFWWVGFLGSNLADLDVLYAGGLVTPSALGSLLHHRGHTHTVVFALLEGFLLAFGAKKWLDRKRYIFPASDQWALSVLAFVSPLFHLFFDALNFYGVHPFWPFWNGWIFGDTFFICEPLLWIAFLPVVYFATDRRWVRSLIEAGFVALITVVWILPAARWYTAAVIGLFGWVQWRLHRRWPAEKRAAYCGFIALGVLACFAMASWWARWQIIRRNTELHPHAVLHDVVLSPFPANPLCWEVITVETFSDGTRYRLKRGKFSLLPGLLLRIVRRFTKEVVPLPI
jgi:inner membrane protein